MFFEMVTSKLIMPFSKLFLPMNRNQRKILGMAELKRHF